MQLNAYNEEASHVVCPHALSYALSEVLGSVQNARSITLDRKREDIPVPSAAETDTSLTLYMAAGHVTPSILSR